MTQINLDQQERKRLDRQRFIGIQTQKKLLQFRVLINPANGINTQLAKNLILSGVNCTIYDNVLVDQSQFQSNFLISKSDIGRKRGYSVHQKLKQMNPSGKNYWLDQNPSLDLNQYSQQFFKQFTIIVTSQTKFQNIKKWDQISKKYNIPYYNQICCGLFAFSYISLGSNYQYKQINKKDKTISKICNIQSLTLQQCLKTQNLNKSKQSNFLTSIIMMYKAEQENLTYNSFLQTENQQDLQKNQNNLQKIIELAVSMKQDYIKNKQFYKKFISCYGINYCPVYSVIGSIISQEIIKIAQNQFQPGINWLFYDSQLGFASVFKLKSQKDLTKSTEPNLSVQNNKNIVLQNANKIKQQDKNIELQNRKIIQTQIILQ